MLTWRQPKEFIFLFAPMLYYALFFMLVYTLTDFYAGGLMFNTAVFRNIMSYYPIVCLLTSLLIKDIMMSGSGALAR